MQTSFGCGGMNGGAKLSEALQRLKDEHGPLRERMEGYYESILALSNGERQANYEPALRVLQEQVESFAAELDLHSEREEGMLFPMMARYIGRETGPIAVMEYEHDLAKTSLKRFSDEMAKVGSTVGFEAARRIVRLALDARSTLSDHFMKEENVLFPMAEGMLKPEEKAELLAAWSD